MSRYPEGWDEEKSLHLRRVLSDPIMAEALTLLRLAMSPTTRKRNVFDDNLTTELALDHAELCGYNMFYSNLSSLSSPDTQDRTEQLSQPWTGAHVLGQHEEVSS